MKMIRDQRFAAALTWMRAAYPEINDPGLVRTIQLYRAHGRIAHSSGRWWSEQRHIAVCRDPRSPHSIGDYVSTLAHEFMHARQYRDGRPYNEAEASTAGYDAHTRWLARIRRPT